MFSDSFMKEDSFEQKIHNKQRRIFFVLERSSFNIAVVQNVSQTEFYIKKKLGIENILESQAKKFLYEALKGEQKGHFP